MLFVPSLASAAWLGYRNDTGVPIRIQTATVDDKGQVSRGPVYTLIPGEIAWDNISTAGPREVSVYDPKANNRLLVRDKMNVGNQNVFLSVQLQAQPQVPGKPPVPPVVRMVAIQAPAPPGQAQPKGPQNPAPNNPVPPKGALPPTSKTPEQPKSGDKPKDTPPPAEKPKTPPPPPPPPAEKSKESPPADKSKSG